MTHTPAHTPVHTPACNTRGHTLGVALLHVEFKADDTGLNIYILGDNWRGGWSKAVTKQARAVESVILDDTTAESIIRDATDFLGSADWYQTHGVPYRRGYLLYGPPGCGKTSFAQVLAGALKLDLCMLTLSDPSLDDQSLAECFRDAPQHALILLEDVDAVFHHREAQGQNKSQVTFSGLLNAIDGAASQVTL